MTDSEWERESQRRHGLTAQYFKPKENQTIQDFITTARNVSKEEKADREQAQAAKAK